MFKVKTLAVLSLAYPREMKHIPRNLNLPPFCRCLFLWKWYNPFPRARARLKHAHSFDRCGPPSRTTQGSRLPLARSNTGSPRFMNFPSLCACSESSLTNLIGSGLNLLCLQSHSKRNVVGAGQRSRFLVLTKRSAASGDENVYFMEFRLGARARNR